MREKGGIFKDKHSETLLRPFFNGHVGVRAVIAAIYHHPLSVRDRNRRSFGRGETNEEDTEEVAMNGSLRQEMVAEKGRGLKGNRPSSSRLSGMLVLAGPRHTHAPIQD
ncbi:hypothetical protein RB195_019914 [Necator americanus]|uniref:Uncharacterized protein n=1 Tax=Necator americanus TaxID=51031 RepID=A0ABR1CGC1_NECAM